MSSITNLLQSGDTDRNKMFTDQMKSLDQLTAKKRKRELDQEWKKVVKRKIKDEEKRITDEEETSYQANRELYALFNDLQGISKEFCSFFI